MEELKRRCKTIPESFCACVPNINTNFARQIVISSIPDSSIFFRILNGNKMLEGNEISYIAGLLRSFPKDFKVENAIESVSKDQNVFDSKDNPDYKSDWIIFKRLFENLNG